MADDDDDAAADDDDDDVDDGPHGVQPGSGGSAQAKVQEKQDLR